ncbi:four-helix bundle copper-binding protein [Spirosoma radiotolerans]|uniref:four-helix bundle copper-binding protein n=1 Tax=Spirosoma radiotolerans TaxID=1379870 RepID=UPI000B037A60
MKPDHNYVKTLSGKRSYFVRPTVVDKMTTIMETMQHNHSHTDTCFSCAEACERCATACLEMGDKDGKGHDMTTCIKLCRDCADICTLCGRLDARGSEFSRDFMALCAEVCEACAEECEKHADHFAHCKACAEACRKCAEECRSMSANA